MKLKAIKYFDVSNMREDTEPFLFENTVKFKIIPTYNYNTDSNKNDKN